MSESDIKLVPNQVIVEALDLCVDSPLRRHPGSDPAVPRRALCMILMMDLHSIGSKIILGA